MAVQWNWVLIVAGALLVLVEVALGGFAGFDLVLIGSSFLVGGALGLLFGNAVLGLVVASVLCVAYIAVGRRWVRGRMQRQGLPTNTDALIGQQALVTEPVAEHRPGQVRLRDEMWRARPAPGAAGPFEAGTLVTVEAVDGVTLLVRR
ncbi:MAG: NfeD family protein [Candidatus Eisenbacteria bacterium]|nr:NfeD family protein [Candidatus Eisenbacteria bacterium]